MAPRLTRWIVAALLGCAALAIARLPFTAQPIAGSFAALLGGSFPGGPGPKPTPERNKERRLQSKLRQAEDRLQWAMDSDEVATRIVHSLARTGARVLFDSAVSAEEEHAAQGAVDSALRELHLAMPGTQFVLKVLFKGKSNPFLYSLRGPFQVRWRDGSTACVEGLWLGRGRGRDRQWLADLRRALEKGIGTCQYFIAFGLPGSRVEEWLGAERPLFLMARFRFMFLMSTEWDRESQLDSALRHLNFFSVSGKGCAEGSLELCHMLLFDSLDPGDYTERFLMSDLIHDMGRERFARFWRSPAPVDSAFIQAFGLPIEQWAHHREERLLGPILRPSPRPRPPAIAEALFIALLALGGALLYSSRREVG